jgi:hypothetical protein
MNTDANSQEQSAQKPALIQQSNKPEPAANEAAKATTPHFKKTIKWEKMKTWLAPLGAIIAATASAITAIVAVYSIHHQAQLEETNRKQEHEKWEASFAAQIQLANTNRQSDFLIWQEQLSQQHTNWMLERNIEWAKQQEIWRQQRSEEWTRQLLSLQAQQKKLDLSEKEGLYQDFVFNAQKMVGLIRTLGWDEWKLYCLTKSDIILLRKSTASEIQFERESAKEVITRWENRVEKEQTELDTQVVAVLRLMQSIKLKCSPAIERPVNIALAELSRLQIGIPESPEIDELIHKTSLTSTNDWYVLRDFYNQNVRKYVKPERFEKSWEAVDEMMWREITLERGGIEVKPEYLTNSGPFVLPNGILTLKREDPEKLIFDLAGETNEVNQTVVRPADKK